MEAPPWKREVPREVMVDIFSRMPTPSVMRMRCLSKQWRSTLGEDHFWDLHAERWPEHVLLVTVARTEAEPAMAPAHGIVRLWCSTLIYMPCATCNGLVCIPPTSRYDQILVCNPLTSEHIALPPSPTGPCSVDLGYSPSSNHYKVACIRRNLGVTGAPRGEMWVHTLGADAGWRKLHVGVDLTPQWQSSSGGLCIDGKMYWVVSGPPPLLACLLLSFDVDTEDVTMTHINVPSIQPTSLNGGVYRLFLRGGRQVSMIVRDGRTGCIEEWVMLGDRTWRLTRRFDCLRDEPLGWLLAVSKPSGNGDMIIVFKGMTVHIHNGRIASTGPGPPDPTCESSSSGRVQHLDWSVCGGYQPSLFPLSSFGGGYEIQRGGLLVDWANNLLPPPDIRLPPSRSCAMYLCQSTEPPSASNIDDGGSA